MAEYHGAARAVGGCTIYVRYSLCSEICIMSSWMFEIFFSLLVSIHHAVTNLDTMTLIY